MSGIEDVPAEAFAHGTRARYVGGRCRCTPCRQANALYYHERKGQPANGLVDAGPARAHLEALSAQGVGKRAVRAASDLALSVLQDIRSGLKTRIRASTARRILAVDAGAAADGAYISGKQTREAIAELRRAGLTKGEIALRLGSTAVTPTLQLKRRRVTARNAYKVQRLVSEVRAELEVERRIGSICPDCGDTHSKARRLEWLRLFREAEREAVIEARPCWYGGEAGRATLSRDLHALREAAS